MNAKKIGNSASTLITGLLVISLGSLAPQVGLTEGTNPWPHFAQQVHSIWVSQIKILDNEKTSLELKRLRSEILDCGLYFLSPRCDNSKFNNSSNVLPESLSVGSDRLAFKVVPHAYSQKLFLVLAYQNAENHLSQILIGDVDTKDSAQIKKMLRDPKGLEKLWGKKKFVPIFKIKSEDLISVSESTEAFLGSNVHVSDLNMLRYQLSLSLKALRDQGISPSLTVLQNYLEAHKNLFREANSLVKVSNTLDFIEQDETLKQLDLSPIRSELLANRNALDDLYPIVMQQALTFLRTGNVTDNMLLKMLANEQFSDLSNELKTEYQKIGDQWLVAENFKPLLNTAVKNDDESSLQAIALLIKKNQSWQVHNGLIKEQIFSRDRNLEETKSLVNLYEIAFSAQTSELLPGLTHKLLQTNDKYLKNWIGTWIDNNLKNENQLNAIAGLAHSNDPLVVLFYMIQLAKFPTTENIDKILAYVSLPQNLVTDEALARLSKIKLSESYIPQLLKMLENPLDERKSFALTLLSKNFKQVPSNSKIVALIDQFIRELEIQIKVSGKDDDDYSMGSIPYGISKTGSLRLKLIQYLSLSL